ncbi:MAG: DUF3362 domain-containing protein, partial [Spongiibacter marinus]
LHKAYLRYHDPEGWPALRESLLKMGRKDLIGYGKKHLVPPRQPANWKSKNPKRGRMLTQHTGLPPRKTT